MQEAVLAPLSPCRMPVSRVAPTKRPIVSAVAATWMPCPERMGWKGEPTPSNTLYSIATRQPADQCSLSIFA